MTDAPERVWAWTRQSKLSPDHVRMESVWTKHPRLNDGTAAEYIRADIHAAEVEALRAERDTWKRIAGGMENMAETYSAALAAMAGAFGKEQPANKP